MSEPFIGQITMFGGNFAPRGWSQCDGQLLSISQNSALFSILGTTYGGDGRTTFGLPDLRGRSPVHEGAGTGLNAIALGQKGGTQTTTDVPSHTHTANAIGVAGNAATPAGNYSSIDAAGAAAPYHTGAGQTPTPMNAGVIGSTGTTTPINNYHPYQAVTFIIALTGVFPSRN